MRAIRVPVVALLLCIVGVPIATNFSLLDMTSNGTLCLGAGLAILAAWSLHQAVRGGALALRWSPPLVAMTAFTALACLSSAVGGHAVFSWRALLPLVLAGCMVWLWPSGDARAPAIRRVVLRAWVLLAGLMSVHAALQIAGVDPFFVTTFHGIRGQSFLRHPNVLAGHLAMTAPLVALAFPDDGRHGRVVRRVLLGLIVFGMACTLSRGGGLALGAAGITWLALRSRLVRADGTQQQRHHLWRSLGVATLVGVPIMLVALAGIGESEWQRLASPLGVSGGTRTGLWAAALSMAQASPIWGSGYGVYPLLSPAHIPTTLATLYPSGQIILTDASSEYLQTLAELGWPGLVLLLALLGAVFGSLRTALRASEPSTREAAVYLTCGVVAWSVHSVVHATLRYPPLLVDAWVLIALVGTTTRAGPGAQAAVPRGGTSSVKIVATLSLLLAVVAVVDGARRTTSRILFVQAVAATERGDRTGASSALSDALDLDPHHVEARYQLASIRFANRDYEGAYRAYSAVHIEAPFFANVLYNLGLCALHLNRPSEARKWLAQSLETVPHREVTRSLLKRLGGSSEE